MLGDADDATNDVGDDPHAVDVGWHSLSSSAVRIWTVRATANAGVWLGAVWTAAAVARATDLGSAVDIDIVPVAAIASALILVVWVATVVIAPRRFRVWRWTVDDQRLIVERGWWRHRRLQAPIGDVHTVAEQDGPILRRWDACSVEVYTSGPIGSVTLPVVDRSAVASMRRQLGFDE